MGNVIPFSQQQQHQSARPDSHRALGNDASDSSSSVGAAATSSELRTGPPMTVEEHVESECGSFLLSSGKTVDSSWENLLTSEKLCVWRRPQERPKGKEGTLAFEYALRGKSEVEPRLFFETSYTDLMARKKWDESCADARLLRRDSKTSVETMYWVTSYPWPVSPRDYVFHRHISKCPRNETFHAVSWVGPQAPSGMLTDFTPKEVSFDPYKGAVRVVDYRTSMLVRRLPQGGCEWALRVLDDPKVAMVPSTVVNFIVSRTIPSSSSKLDRACLARRDAELASAKTTEA